MAALLLQLSCQQQPQAPPAKPFAGVRVTMAAPDDPTLRAILQRHGSQWASQHDAKIEIVADASLDADLYFFAPSAMADLVAANRLAALPNDAIRSASFDYGGILRSYQLRLAEWKGTIYAVPVVGEALVGVYRRDLLDDALHKKAIAQKLNRSMPADGPATWQQVLAIAEYFATAPRWDDLDNRSAPKTSLAPLPADAASLDREFHSVAASMVRRAAMQQQLDRFSENEIQRRLYDYQFEASTGNPLIASPGFVAALQLMQSLGKFRPPGDTARPAESFRNGHAVFALVTLADVAWMQQKSSPVADKFSVCRVPGSEIVHDGPGGNASPVSDANGNFIPYLGAGGFMAGVGAKAPHRDAALNLLVWLGGPHTNLEISYDPSWGSGPTRHGYFETVNRAGFSAGYGFNSAGTNQLISVLERTLNSTVVNPAYRLRIPQEELHLRAFATRVSPALHQGTDAATALQAVERDWKTIEPDPAVRKRNYRLSIGRE